MIHLLFVAGGSPQIITETVYAMIEDGVRAGKISVLTTTTGRQAIESRLFARGGAWSALRREYPHAKGFEFSKADVILLKDARGQALADVRSAVDSAMAADQIAEQVWRLTKEGAPPLHASIAGGRKTMGYLLAAAMMLYGRAQDRLSHVLVHPSALEGTDFFFPPRRAKKVLTYRREGRPVRVESKDLRIELADLPFPRLRGVRDPAAWKGASFSQLVSDLQQDLDALAAPRLTFLPDGGGPVCNDRPVRLSPAQSALYELLAKRRKNGCGQARCQGCASCFVSANDLAGCFRAELRQLLQSRQSVAIHPSRWNEESFRSERSKIQRKLRSVLRKASEPFEIVACGERGSLMYGLRLSPEAITLEA